MMCSAKECGAEGTLLCHNCGLSFCGTHAPNCVRCHVSVCADCNKIFHSGHFGELCGDWPTDDVQARKRFLIALKSLDLIKRFAEYLKRVGYEPMPNKVAVAITAYQRGDFHKFKWSIQSNRNLVAILPLNEVYEDYWLKDMLSRAEALELIAPGQWMFVHSQTMVSKRFAKENQGESGTLTLSKFEKTPFHTKHFKLSEARKDEETSTTFEAWATQEETKDKIYDANSIVPLYNSDLVRRTRNGFLKNPSQESVDQNKCELLLGQLRESVAARPVLVLWGTRTGGGQQYLDGTLPAREFRHKTGKALVRLLSTCAQGKRVRILGGEALKGVEADIDLTCLWEQPKMKERFGIDAAFNRIEQEYIFYKLAKMCDNTLHIGMQSGNIEPLINNPRSNVICINESSRGGAGLRNVDKISSARTDKVHKGLLKPYNMYLSYSLSVLPTAIGELTRILMEEYTESISIGAGLRRLIKEYLKLEIGPDDEVKKLTPKELIKRSGQQLVGRVDKAHPQMLAERGEKLVAQILVTLAGKLDNQKLKHDVDNISGLRGEIQLLCQLVSCTRPRAVFAIRCLHDACSAPPQSTEEFWLNIACTVVKQSPQWKSHKEALERDKREKLSREEKVEKSHGLPGDLRDCAVVLINAFRGQISEDDKEEMKTYQALCEILELAGTAKQPSYELGKKKQGELNDLLHPNPQKAMMTAWNALRVLEFDEEDWKDLAPTLLLIERLFELKLRQF